MTRYLITPTLLNKFQYYIQDEYKSPADSRADFLKTLSREKFEPNEDMAKGLKFEKDIELNCKKMSDNGEEFSLLVDGYTKYERIVQNLSNIVLGGLWQQSCKKDLRVGNQEFLLYGKCDVVKRDTIYDIKFISNYELGKFIDSSQHLIYLYCLDLPKFQYLVSDGNDYWVEDYYNHAGIENEIKSKISDFMGYLENDQEAKQIYFSKWESL